MTAAARNGDLFWAFICLEKRAGTPGKAKCTWNGQAWESLDNSSMQETGKFVFIGAIMGFFPAVKASAASLDSSLFRHESVSRDLMGKCGGIQTLESDSVYANLFLYPLQGHKRGFFKPI